MRLFYAGAVLTQVALLALLLATGGSDTAILAVGCMGLVTLASAAVNWPGARR